MKVLTFAAGLSAGYVLGTRAGREKYEQLVRAARNLSNQPAVVQTRDRIRNLAGAGVQPIASATTAATQTTGTTVASARKAPKKATPAGAGETPA